VPSAPHPAHQRVQEAAERKGVALEIERVRTGLAREAPGCGRCRLVDREEALRTWPKVYDQALPKHPGMYSRSETWWKHKTLPEQDLTRGNFSGRFYVQYEENGEPLGYARYRVRGDGSGGEPGALAGRAAVERLPAAVDFVVGSNRFPFGLLTQGGELIEGAAVEGQFFRIGENGNDLAGGEFTAHYRGVKSESNHVHASGELHVHLDVTGVYVVDGAAFDAPGLILRRSGENPDFEVAELAARLPQA